MEQETAIWNQSLAIRHNELLLADFDAKNIRWVENSKVHGLKINEI